MESRPQTPDGPPRDIVCFSNDWSGDPLSKQQVMRRLIARHRVLWIDSLGNRTPRLDGRDSKRAFTKLRRFARGVVHVAPNLWVLSPLALPIYGSRVVDRVNQALLRGTVRAAIAKLGFRRVLSYAFMPASAWVVGQLGEAHVIYHCVDEYAAFTGAGQAIAQLEERLVRRADLVLACSDPLYQRKRALNPNTVLLRHGVDHAHFARALDPATEVPADIAALPRPILGFFGLIEDWIDLALVRGIAEAFPHASIVLIGQCRVSPAPLAGLGNIHLLGRRSYASLPGYCRAFDVALLPFVQNELTLHSSPLKLREYLSAGVPVVASDIPEARALAPLVRVAHDPGDFIAAIGDLLESDDDLAARRRRSQAMHSERWDARVAEIEAHIAAL